MRLIAFSVDGVQIRKILEHIGVDSQAPLQQPRHAGHHSGTTVMRRWMTGRESNRTGPGGATRTRF